MDTKDYEKDGHSGEADFSKEYSPEGREPHINPVRDTDEYEAHLELETTHRGLKARHISMIAIGGAVGTGLIIGSGQGLPKAGPVGMLLGYSIMGLVCFGVMISLGEMATYLPHKKGFAGYATRYLDPAIGFALGWNYLFKYLIVTPNNIVAGVVAIQYWDKEKKYNPAIWITLMIGVMVLINLLGVRVFGEVEFWLSLVKVLTLTGLILLGIILDLGGGPNKDRIGFRYWKTPGPFGYYLLGDTPVGTFLGAWYAFPNALFAYIGTELVGVTVGECKNPRKQVPKAIKSTFYRILFFYIGGIIVIGWLVPWNSKLLKDANSSAANANASPFVVAIIIAGIKVLPGIINACIFLFVFSAANSDLYIGSRTLFALAIEGQAPAIFAKVSSRGIPYYSLALCTLFCGLAYCACATSALTVFKYFVSLISMFGGITWICILWSQIRFRQAMAVQGMSRDDLPWKAPFQPYGAWICLVLTSIVILFKGFDAFIPTFKPISFVTNYIGIPIFFLFWASYKLVYKSKWVTKEAMDLVSGVREIDQNEAELQAEEDAELVGKNFFMRWWLR